VGFAVGIVCILVGLIVSWPAVAVGAAITLVFGFLWVRDVTRGYRTIPEPEPEEGAPAEPAPALPAHKGPAAMPEPEPGEVASYPRSKFLEGATLGLGAVIGGVVTVPAVGFAVVPVFLHQEQDDIDIGPISDYPEGQFVITTFLLNPDEGEVSRRTAYIRNNGLLNGQPSFTVLSNRCVHLGCPVQPNGPIDDDKKKTVKTKAGDVAIIPTQPAGFGCPCHGGQYNTEGNVTAGPPVRSLDRYSYEIRNGRLVLTTTYSVGHVEGEGAQARIAKYNLAGPGQHVDGPEQWFYPLQPPH
jgi:Rieske Fe-S protein